MNAMTLREICTTTGVSRRAVQGYEAIGLVKATGKNIYGHLLYDENAKNRIKKIRLFQDMGFSLKEIKKIIDAPAPILKEALKCKQQQLKKELTDKKQLLHIITNMIQQL